MDQSDTRLLRPVTPPPGKVPSAPLGSAEARKLCFKISWDFQTPTPPLLSGGGTSPTPLRWVTARHPPGVGLQTEPATLCMWMHEAYNSLNLSFQQFFLVRCFWLVPVLKNITESEFVSTHYSHLDPDLEDFVLKEYTCF